MQNGQTRPSFDLGIWPWSGGEADWGGEEKAALPCSEEWEPSQRTRSKRRAMTRPSSVPETSTVKFPDLPRLGVGK